MRTGLLFIATLILSIGSAWSQERYVDNIFNSVNIAYDVKYGEAPDYNGVLQDLLMDVYTPANDTDTSRIVILYMHGGGFTDPNQTKSLVHIERMCRSWAKKGYVAVSLDYRLDVTPSHRAITNAMHDTKAAVRFFKANSTTYDINPNWIFLGGESAGAVNAIRAAFVDDPSEVNQPQVMPMSLDQTVGGNSGNPGYSEEVLGTFCLCGGTGAIGNNPFVDPAVINMPGETAPSILFVHGTADPLIPYANAQALKTQADNEGVYNRMIPVWGAGHCPWATFLGHPHSGRYLYYLSEYVIPYWVSTHFVWGLTKERSVHFSEVEEENPIKVYPNPSHGMIQVDGSLINGNESTRINVYNLLGKVVYEAPFNPENAQRTIDLSHLEAGSYYLSIFNDNQVHFVQNLLMR